MLREIKAKGGYIYDYGEQTDDPAGADDSLRSLVVLYWGFPGSRYVALGIYIVACLTDLLDGYIARHYNQVSDFGKFMDPLADKCLVMAALCWFVEEGTFFAWVLAIVLLREFAVSGMRLVAVEKGRVIAAGWSGKVKTASTMVCICLILLGIPQCAELCVSGRHPGDNRVLRSGVFCQER